MPQNQFEIYISDKQRLRRNGKRYEDNLKNSRYELAKMNIFVEEDTESEGSIPDGYRRVFHTSEIDMQVEDVNYFEKLSRDLDKLELAKLESEQTSWGPQGGSSQGVQDVFPNTGLTYGSGSLPDTDYQAGARIDTQGYGTFSQTATSQNNLGYYQFDQTQHSGMYLRPQININVQNTNIFYLTHPNNYPDAVGYQEIGGNKTGNSKLY